MPRYKKVPTLYSIAVKESYNLIIKFCTNLHNSNIINKLDIINSINIYLCHQIPTCIMDDITYLHSKYDRSQAIITYLFYKTTLHDNIKKFCAKNLKLKLTYWECLFQTSFYNLIDLNLALSCTDEILKLISQYCPNLEYLNATCRYERMRIGPNATSFTLSVTDMGLKYLTACQKLKKVILNEPRSQRNGTRNTITYSGMY